MTRTLTHHRDPMRLKEPFRISGYEFRGFPAVVAHIGENGCTGRGEAAGIYYRGDDAAHMETAIEHARAAIEAGAGREELRALLPPGGGRNALDCALWELESQLAATPVWALAGIDRPRARVTTFTLPADDPATVQRKLIPLTAARAIKIKLAGAFDADAERVRLVRRLRPDVWIAVDANQGFAAPDLERLAALLADTGVALLEQPVPRGAEAALEGWRCPVPLAADESILDLAELMEKHAPFQIINIKLDKCGGLTEGLMMAREIARLGKRVMVGNMAGSALSTAPGFILAQLCDIVDLDGPYFLADHSDEGLYKDGQIFVADDFWGGQAKTGATA